MYVSLIHAHTFTYTFTYIVVYVDITDTAHQYIRQKVQRCVEKYGFSLYWGSELTA